MGMNLKLMFGVLCVLTVSCATSPEKLVEEMMLDNEKLKKERKIYNDKIDNIKNMYDEIKK